MGPGGRLPEGEKTLAAWDKWVEALVKHYSAKGVNEWMMYNEPNLTWFAFKDRKTGLDLVTFWDGTAIPNNEVRTTKVQLVVKRGNFKEPVWVDLLTGNLSAIPAENISVKDDTCTFNDIPVYDGPALLTDKSLLSFVPARLKKK